MCALDRDAMELRKHGVPIRLQEQPFRVLAMLAERPGEIITREQLQERIWGNTLVDFDQSLNKAVNRLREALNDNAGTPHYVETVPQARISIYRAGGGDPSNRSTRSALTSNRGAGSAATARPAASLGRGTIGSLRPGCGHAMACAISRQTSGSPIEPYSAQHVSRESREAQLFAGRQPGRLCLGWRKAEQH